jgi:predicted nucleotidyltransferase
MADSNLVHQNRAAILEIAARHGATNVRVFGSFANGRPRQDSDVDFLVDMAPDRSLLDQVAFIDELKNHLGRSVDVVTERALNWVIRRRILREAKPL